MTREEIIAMAREAGIGIHNDDELWVCDTDELTAFSDLVAAAEREACAKVCEAQVPTYVKNGERWLKGKNGKPDARLKDIAPNLEAAWEQEQLLKNGSILENYAQAHYCAADIRARSIK